MSNWSNYPTTVQAVCRHDSVALSSSTGVAPVELRLDRIHCPTCGLVLWQRDKPDGEHLEPLIMDDEAAGRLGLLPLDARL